MKNPNAPLRRRRHMRFTTGEKWVISPLSLSDITRRQLSRRASRARMGI
jgi:hypothetical protein